MTSENVIEPTVRPWRRAYWFLAALLLAIPAIAQQFTPEVNWGPGDFLIFGIMLAMLGLLLEGASRIARGKTEQTLLMGGAVLAFLLVWAELAVGIFD